MQRETTGRGLAHQWQVGVECRTWQWYAYIYIRTYHSCTPLLCRLWTAHIQWWWWRTAIVHHHHIHWRLYYVVGGSDANILCKQTRSSIYVSQGMALLWPALSVTSTPGRPSHPTAMGAVSWGTLMKDDNNSTVHGALQMPRHTGYQSFSLREYWLILTMILTDILTDRDWCPVAWLPVLHSTVCGVRD